ncbi:MAG: radical SAM protein [Thermodesulfobacteriota bacterium]
MLQTLEKVRSAVRSRAKAVRAKLDMPVKYAAYRRGADHGRFVPDRLYIESTNYCNLKCIMCPTGLGVIKRPKGYMDMDLYRAIVDEMGPLSVSAVLHSWGEPLMHPKLFDMIRYGKKAGLGVETSTNITLLNEDRARAVLDSGLDVLYLALDGATRETYESVRVNAKWDKVLRNVDRLLELKEQTGSHLRVVLQIIAMNETRAEVDEFLRRWDRPGVDQVNVKALDSWGDQVEAITSHRAEEERLPMKRMPCPNLWYHSYIFWDGSLTSCERDYDIRTPLGNVRDHGVMAAWHGAEMRRLRRMHVEGRFEAPACARCVEWSWWTPTMWRSAGTAPKVDSHERDDRNGRKERDKWSSPATATA